MSKDLPTANANFKKLWITSRVYLEFIFRWSLLEVETDATYPDEIQAYAAGIVEGALTWYLIHTHLENTIRAKCEDTALEKQCDKLRDALDRSVNIWKTKGAELGATEPFWHHVSFSTEFFDLIRFTGNKNKK